MAGLAASALGYLAYRHHKLYRLIYNVLMAAMFALFIGAFIWDGSNLATRMALDKYITSVEALDAANSLTVIHFPALLIYAGAAAYLTFLYWLPNLLEYTEPHDKKGDPKED